MRAAAILGGGGGASVALPILLTVASSCTGNEDLGLPDAEVTEQGEDTAEAGASAGGDGEAEGAAPPPPEKIPTLVDVTAGAGLAGPQHDIPEGQCLLAELWTGAPRGIVFGGHPCISQVLTGSVLVGDYDGDGREDLYAGRIDGPGSLYRNLGDGRFDDVTATLGLGAAVPSNGGAWFDADNDGDLDLLVLAWGGPHHELWLNEDGRFREAGVAAGIDLRRNEAVHMATSVAIGDYDRDGWLDLYLTEWSPAFIDPQSNRLLRNLGQAGDPAFEDTTQGAGVAGAGQNGHGTWAFGAAFVDLDEDGWDDLAIASDYGTSALFWNQGDGSFEPADPEVAGVALDDFGMGSAFGDLDRDGRLDWVVTSIFDPLAGCVPDLDCSLGHGNRVYLNRGDRRFEEQAYGLGLHDGAWGWGVALVDLDDDGALELPVANGYNGPNLQQAHFSHSPHRLFMRSQDGDGFTEVAGLAGFDDPGQGRALAVFDFDRDGDRDIVVARHGEGLQLFRNDGAESQGHWLDLHVTLAGRVAHGARVRLERDETSAPQVAQVGAATHFASQSSPELHFGLGPSSAPVRRVLVTAPDGRTRELQDLPVDQRLVIDFE